MKINILFISLIIFPLTTIAKQHGVIYGIDSRQEMYEVSDAKIRDLGRSTVAIIPPKFIDTQENGRSSIKTRKPKDNHNICADEKFVNQGAAAYCTGFLVAPDIVVTAGHCIESEMACKSSRFIFDFALYNQNDIYYEVNTKNIYNCGQLLYTNNPEFVKGGPDLAIVRLTQPAARTPLQLEHQTTIHENDGVFIIGHPLGLPLKYAGDAEVLKLESKSTFRCDLDAYTGNSGSPVFSERSHRIEGMLISGEDDFVEEKGKCARSKICKKGDDCEGEEVLSAAEIIAHLPSGT